jgi:hypothetical protein
VSFLRAGARAQFVGCAATLAALLVTISPAVANAQTTEDHASVFLLVDQSGTMRRDSQAWRKEAAKLLLYSLPNGSTFAASGFGSPEKSITLDPLLLDDTDQGSKNRQLIASLVQSLGDSDQRTDVYGAIRAALNRIAATDPDTLAARPPYIVMLSDFEPDPDPGDQVRSAVCDDLKQTGVHFIAVGFGRVHRPTLAFLQSCGDVTVWGPVADSPSLMDVFWKIQHRISRALPIEQSTLRPGERTSIPLPAWAQQGFVLAWTRDQGNATPNWNWDVAGGLENAGKSFRVARWHKNERGSLEVSSTAPVQLSVVAAGPLQLQATFDPPAPWLTNEPVRISAGLASPATGALVTEWIPAAGTEASGKWAVGTDAIPLAFDSHAGAVEATWIPPAPVTSSKALLDMSVAGAHWTRTYDIQVLRSPLRTSTYTAGRLFEWQTFSIPLESALPGRTFTLTVHTSDGFVAVPSSVKFTDTTRTQFISLERRDAPSLWFVRVFRGLAASVNKVPDKATTELVFDIQPSSGIERSDVSRFTVELRPYPQWMFWLAATLLLGIPVILITMAIIGPAFPRGFLTPCDLSGRAMKPGDLIELHSYRKRLHLESWGMCNATLRVTFRKRIFVTLGPGTRLLKASDSYRPNAAVSMQTCKLDLDDILASENAGKTIAYKFR